MILEDGDYDIGSETELVYNPFKRNNVDNLKTKIKYECAYCESKNTTNVRKYNFVVSFLIRIWDFLMEL